MKKLLIWLILILLLFSGCGLSKEDDEENYNSQISFYTGTLDESERNWEDPIGTFQGDAIPTKEVAINVAVQIFEGMEKHEDAEDFVPFYVFYDEQDKIWIVSFHEPRDSSEDLRVGGDCSIALQQKDGKVLRIWWGE